MRNRDKSRTIEEVNAAGGVLYYKKGDALFVLLIYRNGVWDLPKGKVEKDEDIESCAIREVAEEVGLHDPPQIEMHLCNTFHEYEQGGIHYAKTTWWYAMPAGQQIGLHPQLDEGITALEWVSVMDAMNRVGFENLKKVLRKLMTKIN